MTNFEDFLSEGKKLQIKRKYTENHPAQTVGKTANVRNAVIKAIADGVITREEYNTILSELSSDSRQWSSRNRKYFNVSEEGIKLSKWGRKILAELDETPKAAKINEKKHVAPEEYDIQKNWEKLGSRHWHIPFDEFKSRQVGKPDFKGGKMKDIEVEQWFTQIAGQCDGRLQAKILKGFDKHGKDYKQAGDNMETYKSWIIDAMVRCGFMVEGVIQEELLEKIKVTKDEWPYIEFKDGGKKHKVEFDYEDIIDDHGNEGQDQYWIGKDEDGQEWQIDVYASMHGEVEEIHYDTIVKESKVNEKDDAGDHLDKLAELVGKARDFFAIGKELKAGKYKYDYSDSMMPMYTIKADGFKFAILNKRYVDSGDREVGEIAIGLMENIKTEITNMENTFSIHESFGAFLNSEGILNEAINSVVLRSVLSNGREGKQAKKNLSMLAKGFYGLSKVALDKIEDEDFIVSNDVSKVFKNYGGSSHVLFFISDNEKENPYYDHNNGSWNDYKIVPGGGIVLAAMSGDRQFYSNEWSRWSGGRAWSKNKKGDEGQIGINHKYRGWGASGLNNGKRISEVSDRVIVINLELIRQKYSTENLRNARQSARAGATAFKSDKDFRDANRNRYHKILADKAASLPLDKMVSDAIDKLAKQISDGLAKGEKTRYQEIKIGESPKGREVKAKDASQHMSNILDDYSRYVDYIGQAEESEARYGEKESYYERESKNYAKSIKERINKIDSFDYSW